MKRFYSAVLSALLLAAGISLWAAERMQVSAWVTGSSSDTHEAYEDARLFIQTASASMAGDSPVQLTITKRGAWEASSGKQHLSLDGIRKLGNAISRNLEYSSEGTWDEGEAVYRQSRSSGAGCNESFILMGMTEEQPYYVLSKQCTVTIDQLEAAVLWQEEMDLRLGAGAARGQWNVMVQGKPAQLHQSAGWVEAEQSLQFIAEQLGGKKAEQYTDAGTISVSYYTAKLKQTVSNGQPINVQAALHQHSETNEWRLTLGTPLITTEY